MIELIDDQKVIEALSDQARVGHPEEFGKKQAERAVASLRNAIKNAREQRSSERLRSIRNLRDKHIAHYLSETMQEKTGTVEPMKVGDERVVLDASIPIVEALNSWVNNVALPLKEAQAIDRKCAQALWQACTFKIAAG